jgi:hypothetical protein
MHYNQLQRRNEIINKSESNHTDDDILNDLYKIDPLVANIEALELYKDEMINVALLKKGQIPDEDVILNDLYVAEVVKRELVTKRKLLKNMLNKHNVILSIS